MKHLKSYNESLRDKMTAKSNEEILKSLESLSDSDKIITIFKNNLSFDLLPDNLTVKGDLYCGNNQLTELPNNLTIYGDLYCAGNKLTKLPDNLIVGRDLDCSHNQLTELPNNLIVGRDLDCNNNKVELQLLSDVEIGGRFYN